MVARSTQKLGWSFRSKIAEPIQAFLEFDVNGCR